MATVRQCGQGHTLFVISLFRYSLIEEPQLLVAVEILQHAFAAVKFGRHASYHSVLSKIWGLMMASAMCALLGAGLDNWFLDLTLIWGILCNLQGFIMSLMLPCWHRDVPTLFHAVRLRKELNKPCH